jgi:hypothetical protein
MYKKAKELGYEESHRIKNIGIVGCKVIIIIYERQ